MSKLLARVSYYEYDAEKLVKARKAAGLSQEEVSDRLNMSPITLCRIEKKQNASYDKVIQLCEFYGIEPIDVLTHVVSPNNVHPSRNNFLKKSTQCVETA